MFPKSARLTVIVIIDKLLKVNELFLMKLHVSFCSVLQTGESTGRGKCSESNLRFNKEIMIRGKCSILISIQFLLC